MTRLAILLLLAVLAMSLTACEQAVKGAVEQGTGVRVDQQGESITVTGKDGEKVSINSAMPDELKGFPVPQGFEVESGGSVDVSAKDGGKMAAASWVGKGTVESVGDFYKSAMSQAGWKQESFLSMGEAVQAIFTKDDSQAVVSVSKNEDEITVQVMVGKGN